LHAMRRNQKSKIKNRNSINLRSIDTHSSQVDWRPRQNFSHRNTF
jgi:hypothetical protein